jgi:hypothetical protein
VTIAMVGSRASLEFQVWLEDRKNRRTIPHRMEQCGYVPVRNDADKHDGQWRIGGKRQRVYAKSSLAPAERIKAASSLR